MRIGRVTGNMTSVIHDPSHEGYKFLTVRFVNAEGQEEDAEAVFADAAQAGIGDLVLVCEDRGSGRHGLCAGRLRVRVGRGDRRRDR